MPNLDAPKTQADKFREAAKEIQVDEDEAKFDAALEKIAKPQPLPKKKPS